MEKAHVLRVDKRVVSTAVTVSKPSSRPASDHHSRCTVHCPTIAGVRALIATLLLSITYVFPCMSATE
ncbi:hypothetical protein BDN67DRAFT_930915, partial [Paxillus ammoniavirescens]